MPQHGAQRCVANPNIAWLERQSKPVLTAFVLTGSVCKTHLMKSVLHEFQFTSTYVLNNAGIVCVHAHHCVLHFGSYQNSWPQHEHRCFTA